MLVPVSWLREYVDIDIPIELLAEKLTLAGVEVGKLHYIGIPQQQVEGVRWPKSEHLVWDREKLLLGAIVEVKPHPDADRLVLAMVDYGGDELEQCVTGAPNLFDYKGKGKLDAPLWTAFAAEGAEVWDGHSDEPKRMILKSKPLRGIENKSMVCSEKELGISDEHEGIILFKTAPKNHAGKVFAPGTPIQDVFGDIILEVELTPNLARCFSIIGVAREVAALLDKEVCYPSYDMVAEGEPIDGAVAIEIHDSELNPRFTATLLRNTKVQPSPEWLQWRLRAVGQRPINNIVDATNYITFEIGQPTHAFDYDKLVARAEDGKTPTIITRRPEAGETLTTLDGTVRKLGEDNILVTDTASVLSLGGVMGGADTEIDENSTNVLLEAAAWNFINIRKTSQAHKLFTEAGTRFSRGVHPSQSILGSQRGIELMRQTGGGEIARGIVDEYPNPPATIEVELPISEVQRLMGMTFSVEDAADILRRLEFEVEIKKDSLKATVPDHRLDISEGIIGQADLIEEIARIHGYDEIPNTIMADAMPEQWENTAHEQEESLRDLLVTLGLRENISYRFTTPEREAHLVPPGVASHLPKADYVMMQNPISADKTVLRHTLLVNLLESASANARYQGRQSVFEIGSVYLKNNAPLPDEPRRLGVLMTGTRSSIVDWTNHNEQIMDFFDMKGMIEDILDGLNIRGYSLQRPTHTTYHPGRSAELMLGNKSAGVFGELHPLVAQAFDLTGTPVFIAEFDLDVLLSKTQLAQVEALATTPPILQDIALVVSSNITAGEVEVVIRNAGGDLLRDVRLFDVYTGDPIPEGKKSVAYSLTFQSDDRTLTDKEVAKVQKRIVKSAKARIDADLRA